MIDVNMTWQLKEIVQPIATLVASFAGAYSAFLLAGRRIKRDERDHQFGAINRALLVLFNMYGNLETYRQDVLEPFAERDDDWLNGPVVPAKARGATRFDGEALAFLLEKRQPNLYAELLLCECNFEEISQLIQRRDDLVLQQLHPVLGKFLGRPLTEKEVQDAVGEHVVHQLKQLSAGIKDRVVRQIATTKELTEKLRDAAVRMQPGRLPLTLVFFEKKQDEH